MGNRVSRPVRPPAAAALSPAALSPATSPPASVVHKPPKGTPPRFIKPEPTPTTPTPTPPGRDAGAFETRRLQEGPRQRLDATFSVATQTPSTREDAQGILARAGFVRQAYTGIFQVLPFGLRVQDKICRLVESEMRSIGADKVQLSALASQNLWYASGRLDKAGQELFRLQDRTGKGFLLSPTHEEPMTELARDVAKNHTKLPLRLYQITQKYRDELRPRQGLLRSREFLMKDLYTFDYDVKSALETYDKVRAAYNRIFIDRLKLPMLVAEASSGDIGGSLNHEYHIPTTLGEDHVMSCDRCGYVANEEVAEARKVRRARMPKTTPAALMVWRGISKCRTTIVNVWYDRGLVADRQRPAGHHVQEGHKTDINLHAVKRAFPDFDPGFDFSALFWEKLDKTALKVVNLFDSSIADEARTSILTKGKFLPVGVSPSSVFVLSSTLQDTHKNFLSIQEGDNCARCSSGSLKVTRAIELGHTFHLGTRYSEPLGASVPSRSGPSGSPKQASTEKTTDDVGGESPPSRAVMQMGCHGIGISRLMGAIANHVFRPNGLEWPRAVAPYEVVILNRAILTRAVLSKTNQERSDEMQLLERVYDVLTKKELDTVIDDRDVKAKMRYSFYDLIGIPVVVIINTPSSKARTAEVRCTRLKYYEHVPLDALPHVLSQTLEKL